MFDHDASLLLSSLGVVALASTAALGCGDDEPKPIEDVSDVLDVEEGLQEFYCECYGDLYELPDDTDACLSQLDIPDAGEEACLNQVFEQRPADQEVLRCQGESLRDYLSCLRGEGCGERFTCDDGAVVLAAWVCDGDVDCEDGSDEEQNCPDSFSCADGSGSSAVRCDGVEDCSEGEDEADCPAQFVCSDGTEIPPSWVCDGYGDCSDGMDEDQGCPVTCDSQYFQRNRTCGDLSSDAQAAATNCLGYQCTDGTELGPGKRCDGTEDCADGDDELFCE